jgi:pyruvate/2-oxoglutarate/acetoin dehydrogenase E1 component
MGEISYREAIAQAQFEEMRRDPRVFVMGTDVQTAIFGTGKDVAEFGLDRIRNTPISEAGITGVGAGAAMVGLRPIINLSISSFMYCAMDQIVSIISKSNYLYGGQATLPLVIRSVMYYSAGFAAQHSDRPYPIFMSIPGLKIIAPATAYDMKGLLKSAIRDDNPVLCFEDGTRAASRSEIPDGEYLVPLGQAEVKRRGDDVTVVAVSGSVPHALAAADNLADEGISVEVIDPRTLVPLDREAILASVARTGRLVAVDPACQTCSAASEISAIVAEEGFWDLRAPIVRVTTPDVHVPFSPALEAGIYPNPARIEQAVRQTLK